MTVTRHDGYAFLHIARQYGLPYSTVLGYADYCQMLWFGTGPGGRQMTPTLFRSIPLQACYDVICAVDDFEAVKQGKRQPW